jgi:hypothetical protein
MNLLQKYFILTLYITLHTDYNSFYKWTKILILDVTIFGLKMMVKSGVEKDILKFHVPLQSCCCPVQCKKICPERLNWPGRLAGISEGARGISRYFF